MARICGNILEGVAPSTPVLTARASQRRSFAASQSSKQNPPSADATRGRFRLLVLRSKGSGAAREAGDEYSLRLDTRYADRVIGNIAGGPSYCAACVRDCVSCRKPYVRDLKRDIVGIVDLPAVLPHLLEKPWELVPSGLPAHEIMLAIGIHEQVLLETLRRCREWGTKGVIVPLEASSWITAAGRAMAAEICEANGVEISFPKPFCSFDPPRGSVLAEFRLYSRIGAPQVELDVENGAIKRARVVVSAACGATYYVARWLVGRNLSEPLDSEVISKRMHSYPCTASMEWDDELGDTPLHMAGRAHLGILAPYRDVADARDTVIVTPLGRVIPAPNAARDTHRNIEAAKEFILEALRPGRAVTMAQLRQCPGSIPAAISSALLLLKKEGKVKIDRTLVTR